MPGVREELAFGKVLADLRRHDADLAGRYDRHGHDLAFVQDGIEEMPAFAEYVLLDALLALLCENLAGRQVGADLGGDHGHFIRIDVEAAEHPFPDEPRQDDDEHERQGEFERTAVHGPTSFPFGT